MDVEEDFVELLMLTLMFDYEQEDGRLEISLVGRQEEGEYWCQAKDR